MLLNRFLIQIPSRTKPRKKYDFQSGQLRATPFNSWELLGGIDFEDGMVINTWLKNIAKNITGSLSVSKTRPVSRILVAPKRQKTTTRQVTVKKNNWWNSVCVSGVSDSDKPTPPAINFNEFHKIYDWAPKPKIGKISFKLDFAKLIGHQDEKSNKIFQKPKKHHISPQKFALQQFRRGYCEILFFVLGTGPVNRWLLEAPGNPKVHKVGRRAGWLLLKKPSWQAKHIPMSVSQLAKQVSQLLYLRPCAGHWVTWCKCGKQILLMKPAAGPAATGVWRT